jgi:hypothetical protein
LSGSIVKWSRASDDGELEAIRWYLTGHLDRRTKLDLELGAAVNAYEHLRHLVNIPELGSSVQVPLKPIRASVWLRADPKTGQWLKIPEFPELPFTELTPSSKKTVFSYFKAEYPAFYPMDITEVADWGILKDLSRLAKDGKRSEERVVAEIEVSPQESAIVFSVDFSAGAKRAEYWFTKRWLKENKHRFANDGRRSSGTRAKNNPLLELKDLAVARLLALHDFDRTKASRWAWSNQPRDSQGKVIPWFNRRNAKYAGATSPLFEDLRDWNRATKRFERNLLTYLVRQ